MTIITTMITSFPRVLRPSSAKVAPLVDDRDRLPDGRVIYGLTLSYSINVGKAGEITPDL